MTQDRLNSFIGVLFFSFLAGSLGGILAGFIEVLVVTRFGTAPAHFSGLLFAVVAYGILGGALGKICYAGLAALPFHRERRENRSQLAPFLASFSSSALLFLIFVFRAFRDFHAEKVLPMQPLGLLTILVLLSAAIGLFFLLRLLFQKSLAGMLAYLTKPTGYITVLVIILIVSIGLRATLVRETEAVRSPFSDDRQAQIADQPCVILIMVDTLRPDRLSCYGSAMFPTPNIDALAADAALFQQTYSQSNNTKPSTASLLTSRYLTEHRAVHKTDILPSGVTTLAEVFAQAGYYCAGIVTNVNLAPIYNFQQGFHEYVYLPPKFLFGADESASRLVAYGVLRQIWMKLVQSIRVDHFYRPGEVVTNYFEDFLNRNKDRRFFLFLHYMDPHDPYFEHPYNGRGYARVAMPNPDSRFVGPFERNYAQEIQYTDAWIGRVMSDLKKANLYDNSVIVFTSDHGEEFYEHGGWWHGTTLQEEQVRIPLLVKLPNQQNAGTATETLTNIIDVPPTVLRAANLNVPPEMRGRDLFDNQSPGATAEVYAEADFEGNVGQMLRVGPWKYIQMDPNNRRGRPAQQLFYLPDDPREERNLVDTQPDKVSEMAALLKARRDEVLSTQERGGQLKMDAATQERLRALGYTQ